MGFQCQCQVHRLCLIIELFTYRCIYIYIDIYIYVYIFIRSFDLDVALATRFLLLLVTGFWKRAFEILLAASKVIWSQFNRTCHRLPTLRWHSLISDISKVSNLKHSFLQTEEYYMRMINVMFFISENCQNSQPSDYATLKLHSPMTFEPLQYFEMKISDTPLWPTIR